jgi:transcriptional regulator with XRE-family HTH domain
MMQRPVGGGILAGRHMAQAHENRMGYAIRRRREALRLTLKEVAARAGTTPAAVSHIERGIRKPSAEMVARLARALDCSVDDLLMGVVVEIKKGQHIPQVLSAMKAFPPSIQKQVADYCEFLRYQIRKRVQ